MSKALNVLGRIIKVLPKQRRTVSREKRRSPLRRVEKAFLFRFRHDGYLSASGLRSFLFRFVAWFKVAVRKHEEPIFGRSGAS